jgi:uncharacterized protein with ParB-like and HNH nuclease domain
MAGTNGIEAKETTLGNIFSSNFLFEIPIYQRPFVWDAEKFQQLFDDISDARENGEQQYFLGSILLQELESPIYEVVDGQQRLTALSLLFASIRDNTTNSNLKNLAQAWLYQRQDEFNNIPEQMRVQPWEDLTDIFRKYVYTPDGTVQFLSDFQQKTIAYQDDQDPRYHIYEALDTYKNALVGLDSIEKFVAYIVKQTYVVYIKTSTQASAFRLFSVLNSRGEPLNTSDLLKSENLGEIKEPKEREKYAKIWRDVEENLGREDLENVISFIRSIKIQERAKVSVYEEYQNLIFKPKTLKKGTDFISFLKDISNIYSEKVIEGDLNSDSQEKMNRYFTIVNLMNIYLPFSDWKPILIYFYYKHKRDDLLLDLLEKLEQKTFVEWAAGFSFVERLTSLNRILKLIDNTESPQEVIDKLLYFREEGIKRGKEARSIDFTNKEEIKSNLKIFDDPQLYSKYGGKIAKYILLRIEIERSELANIRKEYSGTITVEHILPRTPTKDSSWVQLFTDQQRIDWTNKLGNLVLLSRKKNSQAQNMDFEKKKQVYFLSGKKSTDFTITKELKDTPNWTFDELEKRHNSFKTALFDIYLQ